MRGKIFFLQAPTLETASNNKIFLFKKKTRAIQSSSQTGPKILFEKMGKIVMENSVIKFFQIGCGQEINHIEATLMQFRASYIHFLVGNILWNIFDIYIYIIIALTLNFVVSF